MGIERQRDGRGGRSLKKTTEGVKSVSAMYYCGKQHFISKHWRVSFIVGTMQLF